MIIFEKNNFCIEVDEKNTIKANNGLFWLIPIKLRINGYSIGTFDTTTYVPTFIYSLGDNLLNNDFFLNQEIDCTNSICFFNKSYNSSKYNLTIDDSFDDFYIKAIRNSDSVFLFWGIVENPFFIYSDEMLNKEYYAEISINDLRVVIENFKLWWSKLV